MGTRLVYATLVSAVLLSSYSSAIAAPIRSEVARPLDEARVLANGWGDRATVMAKLNQAASIPNLNKDERRQIRVIGEYVLARVGHWNFAHSEALPEPPPAVGYTGLH